MGTYLKPYTEHMTIQNMISNDKVIWSPSTLDCKNLSSKNQYGKEDKLCGAKKESLK